MYDRVPNSSNGAPSRAPYAATDDPEEEKIKAEAAEIAEQVAESEAEEVAEVAARRRLRPLEALMLAMLAVSLVIHVLTLTRLFSVRNTLRDEIGQLAESVQSSKNDKVRYNLPIDQQIPINLDVPIKRSLTIPIRTEVRIKQDINLPVDTGFGSINIPIPIDATVPISTTVPIDFDQTVNISTTVPLRLNVPIQIDLASPQFSGYLERLHDALLKLRDQL